MGGGEVPRNIRRISALIKDDLQLTHDTYIVSVVPFPNTAHPDLTRNVS